MIIWDDLWTIYCRGHYYYNIAKGLFPMIVCVIEKNSYCNVKEEMA